jgi:hypothetical protein
MLTASNAFINALRFQSYLVLAQLTVFYKGQSTGIILPVSTADFTFDRNSEQRRSGQVTVEILPTVPPQTVSLDGVNQVPLLPITPQAALAPFAQQIGVALQVLGPGGTINPSDWIPMGVYAIAESTIDDTVNDMIVTLKLFDRSWILAQWKLVSSYSVPASDGTLQNEIKALINHVWSTQGPSSPATPPWTYSIVPSTYVVPTGTYNQGQDPWQACLDMAASAGYELYFDVYGNVVGAPAPGSPASSSYPTLNSIPVSWGFDQNTISAQGTSSHSLTGTPFTTPIAMAMQILRDGMYNDYWVAAIGSNNFSSLIQARASDTNPQSPTWYQGIMGDSPNFIYDSLITTLAQAQAEANYDLAVALSKVWQLSIDSAPNPLFNIDDVFTVTNPRMGLNLQKVIIDTIHTSVRYDAVTTLTGRVIVPGA